METLPEIYVKIRARIDELYPGMSDLKASLIATNGRNKDLIRTFKRGNSKVPRGENLQALLEFLQLPASELWPASEAGSPIEIGVPSDATPNAVIGEKIEKIGPSVPLYGSAVGGIHGEFELNGNVLDQVIGPASLAFVRGAYAVMVQGESMFPRYEDAETVFVNPHKRVKRGDYVVAQIQKEEHGPILAYVKKFESRNAEELVLTQLNPDETLRFSSEHVVSVHYILRGGE